MRRAILSLGKYSRWPREELRGMSPQEFAAYMETANEMEEESSHGA